MRIFISNTNLQITMESYFQGSEKNNLKLVYKYENKIKIYIRMPRSKNIYLDILWKKTNS